MDADDIHDIVDNNKSIGSGNKQSSHLSTQKDVCSFTIPSGRFGIMMYYQHQLPHHLILIIYVRAHWQQYEFLITQLQHSRMWACSKMHRFGTKWCTFVLSQADWTILWLQASVAWYYIHEQEGSVRQGKTCWSGTTWTSFSKILPEQRGELKQRGHMRDVLQSAEKPKNLAIWSC